MAMGVCLIWLAQDALRWLERCEEARVDQGRRLDHLGGLALLARDAGR